MPEDILSEDKVLIDKTKLTDILNRLEQLEYATKPPTLEVATEHTCRLRKIGEKIVTDIGTPWAEKDEFANDVMFVEVQLNNEDKRKKVDYLNFMRQPNDITVKILKKNEKMNIKKYGDVEMTVVEGYNRMGTGMRKPIEVVVIESTYTVQLPNGEEMTVKEGVINI